MHKVVITGVGIISVLGNTVDAVSSSLYNGQSGIIVDDQRVELGFNCPLTGVIKDFDPKARLTRKQKKNITYPATQAKHRKSAEKGKRGPTIEK